MGPKPKDKIVPSLVLTVDKMKAYATVTKRLNDYFVARRNIIFEQAQFNKRDQQDGESADAYITVVYSMPQHLQFAELHDDLSRNRK